MCLLNKVRIFLGIAVACTAIGLSQQPRTLFEHSGESLPKYYAVRNAFERLHFRHGNGVPGSYLSVLKELGLPDTSENVVTLVTDAMKEIHSVTTRTLDMTQYRGNMSKWDDAQRSFFRKQVLDTKAVYLKLLGQLQSQGFDRVYIDQRFDDLGRPNTKVIAVDGPAEITIQLAREFERR